LSWNKYKLGVGILRLFDPETREKKALYMLPITFLVLLAYENHKHKWPTITTAFK